MRMHGIVLTLAITIICADRSAGQSPPAHGYKFATDEQVENCKQSALTEAECDNLALEFNQTKSATSTAGLKLSLRDPFADLTPFIVGIRKRAFEQVAAQAAKGILSTDAQAALNSSAQILSTKAAVTQTGANSNASGSTNLVNKPTTTDLISLAAESGAFTDTVNGNSLTAQANADGVRRYFAGKPFADLNPSTLDYLSHITFTATFTVAQSGSTGVSPSGPANSSTPSVANIVLPSNNVSFNSLSVNYSFLRTYNPHSKTFVNDWQQALKDNASSLASAVKAVQVAVLKASPIRVAASSDPDFTVAEAKWATDAKNAENTGDFAAFVGAYKDFTDVFESTLEKANPNNFYSDILSINTALEALRTINDHILDNARGKPLLTFNYTYSTPQGKPATHTATLAAAYVFKRWNGAQLNGNAAGSWFASVPAGAAYGRVQSYQLSAEYDQPIGPKSAPRATLSLAGYGQYQYNPTVLNITAGNLAPGTDIDLPNNAQVLLGTAGWLGVAQAKLVFNVGKGLSIPVAFKWSSKTDLLPGNNWKGQFGITYDFSGLSSMLTGKN
jgi:hypothetical protein